MKTQQYVYDFNPLGDFSPNGSFFIRTNNHNRTLIAIVPVAIGASNTKELAEKTAKEIIDCFHFYSQKQTIEEIAQKTLDTIGANLAALKMFYSVTEPYMKDASIRDKEAVKKGDELINVTSNFLRQVYSELNSL